MKVLENKLIQGKEETETIINSISSGVIIIDAETHIIQKVNKAAATLIGTDEKDLIGRECNDFICPNSKGNCTIECTSEKVDNAERTIRSSLGECIPILKTVTLFQYNGRDCYLESFVDITKIKSNELLIQRKEHILSAIAELTDELLKNPDYYDALSKKLHLLGVATGVDRIYLFENDVIDNELMLSCSQKIEWASNSAEPQIDNPDLMNVPYEAIDIFIEPLKNNIPFVAIIDELEESYTKDVLQSQDIKSILVLPIIVEKTFWGFVGFDECKFERVWTEDEYSILLAFAGTLSAAIDRRKLEYSLQESMRVAQNANRAKSEFLANMSHEIRTPLNAVIGFTDLLMATQLSDTQSDYLRSVNNSAVILLDLINDILDYSKIEAGKLELFLEKTDIRELVNQISDIVKYKAHAKQLEFLISIDENTPQMVMVDGIRLRQVLINLLWNAIKFTDKGEVELSINYKPLKGNIGSFHFCIRDTGIGIPLNKQKVIFEAFSQVDTSATRKYGGTGLGLPISMNLIRKMDSQLVLKSAPGEGSVFCFTIELPIYENTSTTIKNSKTIKHIDIVDDNETNLKILKKMIENMGLNVRAFQSPTKALESIVSETDVYIVDYTMPELNGLSFIEAVKESKKLSGEERYILLHSSTDEIAIKEKATKLNISNVVSKPITSIQLQRLFFPTESRLTTTTNNPKLLEPEQDISQNHFRILIVEDNQVNMKLAISLIRVIAPNSKIFEAQNGRIALEMFEKSRPHLVFMDIQMPEMNGYDAASHIREMEINAGVVNRVPIIALTAGIVSESKDKCFTAGMDDFLPKPIQISCIEAVFRKWVGNLICKKEENSSINPNDRFDKEKLLKSAMNNESLLKELFSISKETLPQYYEALKQGFDNTNWESIKENAHAIKGQALTMQCSQLASLAREAELKAMNKDNSNIAEIITKIGEEIDYLINISFI
jgi:PAS domain S-box-containing protein